MIVDLFHESKPSPDLVAKNAKRTRLRRAKEEVDVLDFLFFGADRHTERCIFDKPCSRDYDPMPYYEAAPTPERDYEGTGIGALYGLPGTERFLWQLAGWNVAQRRRPSG